MNTEITDTTNIRPGGAGFAGRDSARALERMRSARAEPLFLARWQRVVFLHLEIDPVSLQRAVPFPLDLRDGRAYASLVAFTLEGMRPRCCGRLGAWLFRPVATGRFLNLRAYVRHHGEPGIYFLAEWLSNSVSVRLGPCTYGLPYHA